MREFLKTTWDIHDYPHYPYKLWDHSFGIEIPMIGDLNCILIHSICNIRFYIINPLHFYSPMERRYYKLVK